MFGSESGNSNTKFSGILHYDPKNKLRIAYIGESHASTNGYNNPGNDFVSWMWVINSNHKHYLVKNGAKGTTYSWSGELNKITPIAVFCNFVRGSSYGQKSNMALKYFRITDNGVLVFNGIPARRNSDGVLGLYDMVGHQFLTNIGTRTFVAGPDVI